MSKTESLDEAKAIEEAVSAFERVTGAKAVGHDSGWQ